MSLTKDLYDVGDRIIAKIPEYKLNYFGTVTRVLTKGGYTIRYDNGNSLHTKHDQILGLTYESKNRWPNAIQDQSVPEYLLQRVSPESIETVKKFVGIPVKKSEYLVGDKVIVRYENSSDSNYTGTVMNGLKNGFYIIEYKDGSACPAEHIQILGLTDRSSVDPIPDSELRIWLRQNGRDIPPDKDKKQGTGISIFNPMPWMPPLIKDIKEGKIKNEKAVEIFFILPLLSELGYTNGDIHPDKTIRTHSSLIKIDFVLYDHGNHKLENKPLLIVEAKCENLLKKQVQILNAQRQVKEYAYWSGCHFALVTDIKTIQIIDVSNVSHEINVIFECRIEEFENKFNDINCLICKKRLRLYCEQSLQKV
jgi:hypothetical protein